jgi:hypothetical protein
VTSDERKDRVQVTGYREQEAKKSVTSGERTAKPKFLGSPTKRQPLALASRFQSPLCAPRETGAEKKKKQMNEQIKQTNRGQFNVEGSLQVRIGGCADRRGE